MRPTSGTSRPDTTVTLPARARALLLGTVGAGAGVVAVAVYETAHGWSPVLALLAAGVVATEVFEVPGDMKAIRPVERQGFSLSFAVVGAAALLLGPWQAALVAPVGVIVVDGLRARPVHKIAFNASMFALMGLAGGWTYVALGGHPGSLRLPADFAAVAGMLVAAYGVETILLGAMVAIDSGVPMGRHQMEKLRSELPVAAGEAALAIVLASLAERSPWSIVAVLPLMLAVYQSKAGYNSLRRETEHALETLANIVDERDRSTYRHSARVAEHVRALAEALDLPPSAVQRLRWAGRLHDLGKIRVDGAALRKTGPLDDDELEAMRLHPRLAARLLRRFRLAVPEAQAVEYHHERADGKGYYGVRGDDIPLAAHFLIVADAYDAMTSHRSYRDALTRDVALARIEEGLGTQFHPVIGKAFVAMRRGLQPLDVLSPAERATLRDLERRTWSRRRPVRSVVPSPFAVALVGIVASLVFVAFGHPWLACSGVALAASGLLAHSLSIVRAQMLIAALDRARTFADLMDTLVAAGPLTWAAYVSWRDGTLDAEIEQEWRTATPAPTVAAVTSWLIRELESRDDVLSADGADLGRGGHFLALVLRHNGSPVGSLVLGYNRLPGTHVARALAQRRAILAELLTTTEPETIDIALRGRLVAVSG